MSGYWQRLLDALQGRTVEAAPAPPLAQQSTAGEAELRARVSALQMDLEDRDRLIQTMRQEYAALQAARDQTAAGAGQEQLERLFKRLAGPMSNLAALAELSDSGKDVPAADLVSLFRTLEKEAARAGMERIGESGTDVPFDTAMHQRMSGGSVHAGTAVTIRMPGYRMGDRILIKAMVSAREGRDG